MCVNDSFKENLMITIKYLVESNNDLNHYIQNYSQIIREDGIRRFNDPLKATRNIYKQNFTS